VLGAVGVGLVERVQGAEIVSRAMLSGPGRSLWVSSGVVSIRGMVPRAMRSETIAAALSLRLIVPADSVPGRVAPG